MVYELPMICWVCSYVIINCMFFMNSQLWYYLCNVYDVNYQVYIHVQECDYVASLRC